MLREAKPLDQKYQDLLPRYLEGLLAARDEMAAELAHKRPPAQSGDQEGEEAPKAPQYASDLAAFYSLLDSTQVQKRAFEKVFGAWTDEDWARFDQAYFDYVATIKG